MSVSGMSTINFYVFHLTAIIRTYIIVDVPECIIKPNSPLVKTLIIG